MTPSMQGRAFPELSSRASETAGIVCASAHQFPCNEVVWHQRIGSAPLRWKASVGIVITGKVYVVANRFCAIAQSQHNLRKQGTRSN